MKRNCMKSGPNRKLGSMRNGRCEMGEADLYPNFDKMNKLKNK
jgi:hypothetical protein